MLKTRTLALTGSPGWLRLRGRVKGTKALEEHQCGRKISLKSEAGPGGVCCLLSTAGRSDKRENDIIANNPSPHGVCGVGDTCCLPSFRIGVPAFQVNLHVGEISWSKNSAAGVGGGVGWEGCALLNEQRLSPRQTRFHFTFTATPVSARPEWLQRQKRKWQQTSEGFCITLKMINIHRQSQPSSCFLLPDKC